MMGQDFHAGEPGHRVHWKYYSPCHVGSPDDNPNRGVLNARADRWMYKS